MILNFDLFYTYLQHNFDYAKTAYEQGQVKSLPPILVVATIETQDDEEWQMELVVLTEFGPERYDTMQQIGADYGRELKHVAAVYLMSESWISIVSKEEWEGHEENRIAPSEDPDHQECMVVAGMCVNGDTAILYAGIERHTDGKITILPPIEDKGVDNALLKSFYFAYIQAYQKVDKR